MSEFENTIQRIQAAWQASLAVLEGNPAIIEKAVPGCGLAQVEEALKTLLDWASRNRAPTGFRPVFHIAKVHLANALEQLAQQTENLQGNPAGQFPAFLVQLINTLAPISATSMFADKSVTERSLTEAGGELSQHIALMQTTQKELQGKMELLNQTKILADSIVKKCESIDATVVQVEDAASKIAEQAEGAETSLNDLEADKKELMALKTSIEVLAEKNEALAETLKKQSEKVADLAIKTQAQQNLIDALLPRGTSAGLASSFRQQKERFAVSLRVWAGLFIVSLVALACFTWGIKVTLPTGGSAELWTYILFRIPLAAPLVWLGWFCAIQYGNVLRLQEDYAFKEATSMAFAGYRDHMEHLNQVSDEDAGNAMAKLALVTIDILGSDPLRLLQHQSNDASPLDRFGTILKGVQSKSKSAAD